MAQSNIYKYNLLEDKHHQVNSSNDLEPILQPIETTTTTKLEELKSSISSSLYKDVLYILEKEENSQIKELIIYNAKNIQKKYPNSDIYVCSVPKCYSSDKWFMLKHPCKNFYKQKKENRT